MKILRSILATTHVDLHGDKFTREALEGAAAQLGSDAYLPVLWNHDPRIPPIGRAIGAEVVRRDDGEFNLEAISEMFEAGEIPSLSERMMLLRTFDHHRLTLVRDRSYEADSDLFADLSENPNFSVELEGKKALEPISVLLLGMAGAASLFTAGFLNKMGADAYDALKVRIADLLSRRRRDRNEYLFVFEVQVERPGGFISIYCILDTPSIDDLHQFWAIGLAQLRTLLPLLIGAPPEISRFVFQFKEGKLIPAYAVRKDCVPLEFQLPE